MTNIALWMKPISRSDHEKTTSSKARSQRLYLPGDNLVVVEGKMAALKLIPNSPVMSSGNGLGNFSQTAI